jgi:hypothetical protein
MSLIAHEGKVSFECCRPYTGSSNSPRSAKESVRTDTGSGVICLWRSILVERLQSCLSKRRVGRPSTVRHAFAIQRRRWRTLKFDAGAHMPPWNDRVRLANQGCQSSPTSDARMLTPSTITEFEASMGASVFVTSQRRKSFEGDAINSNLGGCRRAPTGFSGVRPPIVKN